MPQQKSSKRKKIESNITIAGVCLIACAFVFVVINSLYNIYTLSNKRKILLQQQEPGIAFASAIRNGTNITGVKGITGSDAAEYISQLLYSNKKSMVGANLADLQYEAIMPANSDYSVTTPGHLSISFEKTIFTATISCNALSPKLLTAIFSTAQKLFATPVEENGNTFNVDDFRVYIDDANNTEIGSIEYSKEYSKTQADVITNLNSTQLKAVGISVTPKSAQFPAGLEKSAKSYLTNWQTYSLGSIQYITCSDLYFQDYVADVTNTQPCLQAIDDFSTLIILNRKTKVPLVLTTSLGSIFLGPKEIENFNGAYTGQSNKLTIILSEFMYERNLFAQNGRTVFNKIYTQMTQ